MAKWWAYLISAMLIPLEVAASSFSLVDTQGRIHQLDRYQGQWVLVNVWATWCAPCVTEMPELQSLHRNTRNLAVLGLSVDSQPAHQITAFAQQVGATYPIIAGNLDMARPFKIKGFPTTVLYDPSGREVFHKAGRVTKEEVLHVMQRAPGN